MQRKLTTRQPTRIGDWGLGPGESYQDNRLGTMRHVLASVALEPGRKRARGTTGIGKRRGLMLDGCNYCPGAWILSAVDRFRVPGLVGRYLGSG